MMTTSDKSPLSALLRPGEYQLLLPISDVHLDRVRVPSDLLHARVPTAFIHQVFDVMANTPQHA